MLKKLLAGLLVIISFAGCLKGKNEFKCNYNDCALKAPESEIQAVQDYLTAHSITATPHCSGLFYVIDDPGTGKPVTACGAVMATYVGKLADGTVFDDGTFEEFLPLSSLVRGWANAIPLIKEGGKIRLYIPPSLGYGNQDHGSIPANSILIFDVTLDAVY